MKKKIGMVVFVLIIINVLTVILLMIHKETTKVEKPDTASKQEMVKMRAKHMQATISCKYHWILKIKSFPEPFVQHLKMQQTRI